MLEGLDRDGAAALLDVIDPDLVRQIDVDLAPYLDTARANPAGNGPSRIGAVIAKTLNVVPILQSRLLNRICERFLLVDSSCYQLSAIHLIEVQPGSPQGTVHRDDAIWPMRGPRSIAVINFLLPITDFTMENGATRVILGSHRWPRDPAKIMPGRLELDVVEPVKQDDLVATPMPSGSIFPARGKSVSGGSIRPPLRIARRRAAIDRLPSPRPLPWPYRSRLKRGRRSCRFMTELYRPPSTQPSHTTNVTASFVCAGSSIGMRWNCLTRRAGGPPQARRPLARFARRFGSEARKGGSTSSPDWSALRASSNS
jgi:hypothetical protein